ncbi:MAG TPA: HPr family phosphocarrier protein, partial [Bifidobacterium sp.]|nr:HPr family phosphocarrier protein [Bifidobacterium sp.]
IKQGDTVVLDVEGDNAEAVADDLAKILISAE